MCRRAALLALKNGGDYRHALTTLIHADKLANSCGARFVGVRSLSPNTASVAKFLAVHTAIITITTSRLRLNGFAPVVTEGSIGSMQQCENCKRLEAERDVLKEAIDHLAESHRECADERDALRASEERLADALLEIHERHGDGDDPRCPQCVEARAALAQRSNVPAKSRAADAEICEKCGSRDPKHILYNGICYSPVTRRDC